jgi:hypothetical protein
MLATKRSVNQMNRDIYTKTFLGITFGKSRKIVGNLEKVGLPMEEYHTVPLYLENYFT